MHVRVPPGVRQQIEVVISEQPSDNAARKLEQAVDEALLQIEMFPESGRMKNPPREDLRVILVGKYRLTYIIDHEEEVITVFSFVYAGLPGDALD